MLIKYLQQAEFIKRAFAEKASQGNSFAMGCGWVSSVPELVRGPRKVVVHNNLIGDVRNMGAIYTDPDVVVDGRPR